MAKLGIKDKNYFPNQYINPMLISQKKEPAMGYGPYKIFDKNNPEHPDYKADDDDDEDIQLSLPIDYAKKNQDMKIAQGFVKKVGEPIGVRDYVHARDIIDRTESNPLKRYLRQMRLEKNNPLDPTLGLSLIHI